MIDNFKVNGAGWKIALAYICGIIAVTQLIILGVWLFRMLDTDDSASSQKWTVLDEPEAHMAHMRTPGEVLQEVACSHRSAVCFYVIDGPSKFNSGYGRWLGVEPLADLVLASVDLNNSYYEPLTAENSRKWPVVVDRISADYVKLMVAQPFLLGTFLDFEMSNVEEDGAEEVVAVLVDEDKVAELEVLERKSAEALADGGWKCVHPPSPVLNYTGAPSGAEAANGARPEVGATLQLEIETLEVVETAEIVGNGAVKEPERPTMKVLCVGLGGAVVGNFFATNFPKEHQVTVLEPKPTLKYLAQKYFGLHETARHRVFVVEPIHYLVRRAHKANKGDAAKKFDFIVVDSCHYTADRPGLCPTDEYTRRLGIVPLKKLLSENGTVVVNVFSASRAKWQEKKALSRRELDILRRYRAYFNTCYYVGSGSNLVLVCTDRRTEAITQHSYADLFEATKLPDYLASLADLEPPTIYAD